MSALGVWEAERARGGGGANSAGSSCCTPDAGRPIQPVAAKSWPAGGPGWRYSCRKTQPELEEFNLEALQRRLVKQRGAANGRTARQDGVLEKLRRAELEHAKRKEKEATRCFWRVASLLASSAGSSSDSSSDLSQAVTVAPAYLGGNEEERSRVGASSLTAGARRAEPRWPRGALSGEV